MVIFPATLYKEILFKFLAAFYFNIIRKHTHTTHTHTHTHWIKEIT